MVFKCLFMIFRLKCFAYKSTTMTILSLPIELQVAIIDFLPPKDRRNLSQTCHILNNLVISQWRRVVVSSRRIRFDPKAVKEYVASCTRLQELVIVGPDRRVDCCMILGVVLKAKATLKTLSIAMFESELSDTFMRKIRQETEISKLEVNGDNVII